LKGKRFLVVDDEHSVADFVRTVIELEGGVVVLAATAALALDCLRAGDPFDLMVLDLALPDISGWELLASAEAHLAGCKVVTFSAQVPDGGEERARSAGVALSLVKPVTATTLRDALTAVLRAATVDDDGVSPHAP
jgi:DNA-binding response OmpR family regulator